MIYGTPNQTTLLTQFFWGPLPRADHQPEIVPRANWDTLIDIDLAYHLLMAWGAKRPGRRILTGSASRFERYLRIHGFLGTEGCWRLE
ncbi:MAG: hypothetical protein CMJ80_04395 [Planctomycetaceae bacterium]|nr:hypothetical protein [Planctomycetaceae bacterium]